MFLNATTDLLRINVATASDIEVHIAYGSADDGAPPTVSNFDSVPFASITGTGNTTILTGVDNDILKPIGISAFNNHASQSTVVYFDYFDGTNAVKLAGSQCTLLAGESLLMIANGRWVHYDSNGAEYPSVGNAASQADMEGAVALDRYVTPGRQHFHPAHPKARGKITVAGGTPTLQESVNITSITDTATDQVTVTIATDFSTTHYTIAPGIEAATTTLSATTTSLLIFIRNATQAVGSFILQSCEIDVGGATDPAAWHFTCCGDFA